MNLNHPFALNISDLKDLGCDFEPLTDEETAEISGGETTITTLAVGEEGGGGNPPPSVIVCISAPCPGSESGGEPSPKPPKPPKPHQPPVYTKAGNEIGSGLYTKALNETGGSTSW